MAQHLSASPAQTAALGRALARRLHGGELIAFTGGLGVGKTAFCTGIASGLGTTDPVSSPTYTIANYYRGPQPFAHFDAYRVQGPEDLEAAGLYDYLDAGAVVAIEWSENARPLPEEAPLIQVDMEQMANGRRKITIRGVEGL